MSKKYLFPATICIAAMMLCSCTSDRDNTEPVGTEQTSTLSSSRSSLSEIQEESTHFDSSYKNLDLSDTRFVIPQTSTMYDLTFPVSTDSLDRQIEKFQENLRTYQGLDADTDLTSLMYLAYWDNAKNNRVVVPLTEATKEQRDQIQYLGYNDGECYELVAFSNFMLEMGKYKIPAELTGDTKDYSDSPFGYRVYELGDPVRHYDLTKDSVSDISYPLYGGEYALSDAVSYVEKHFKEDYHFVGSDLLDYQVFGVDVRQLSDDVYYYEFDISTSYKGVTLNKDDCTHKVDETKESDSLDPVPFGTHHLASVYEPEEIGFIWSCCQNFESVQENESYESFLSIDQACQKLSEVISSSQRFTVSSVELEYRTEFVYENEEKKDWGYIQSIHCRPAYHFVISNSGLAEFNRLYFDVDAITGEVITMVA